MAKSPRILIVSQFWAPEVGAPQVRLAAMASQLQALGCEVDVVTTMPNYPTGSIFPDYQGKRYSTETIDGVGVTRIWSPTAHGRGIARKLSLVGFAALEAVPLIRHRKPDLVFVNSAPLTIAPVALAAARRWRVPAVLGISDLWPDSLVSAGLIGEGLPLRLLRRLERSMYRRFDALSPVTDGMIEILLESKNVPAEKLAPLPNGVDCDMFRPGARGVNGSKKTFAYCGTIGFLHGAEVIVEAMDLLRDSRPDIEVVFVGGGSERDRIQEMASSRGLDAVTFRDPIPPTELAKYFNQVTAGLVTLRDVEINQHARSAKTFPLMAAGLPVVLSGAGETARIVSEANAGIISGPANAEDLAASMVAIADDPERASTFGENGRRYALDNLSWKSNVTNWFQNLRARDLL